MLKMPNELHITLFFLLSFYSFNVYFFICKSAIYMNTFASSLVNLVKDGEVSNRDLESHSH